MALFRGRVLVPALTDRARRSHERTPTLVEDLVGLVALVPEPPATDAPATGRLEEARSTASTHAADHLPRTYNTRRAASAHERANPPPMIKKVNFCGPDGTTPTAAGATNPPPARAVCGRLLVFESMTTCEDTAGPES